MVNEHGRTTQRMILEWVQLQYYVPTTMATGLANLRDSILKLHQTSLKVLRFSPWVMCLISIIFHLKSVKKLSYPIIQSKIIRLLTMMTEEWDALSGLLFFSFFTMINQIRSLTNSSIYTVIPWHLRRRHRLNMQQDIQLLMYLVSLTMLPS